MAAAGKTLVFVRTKRGADRLARKLGRHDVRALAMHGDLSQRQRQRALARFENGDVAVLVATDVAARGLDIEHIAHVVNYDPPMEHKEYVHRTGRTGRAGREGTAVTFVLPTNRPTRAGSRTVLGTTVSSRTLVFAPHARESSIRVAGVGVPSGRRSTLRSVVPSGGVRDSHGLFHELTERAAVLRRDRAETARVPVALVAREGQLSSSDREPARGSLLNVDDESHRARIAGGGSCGFHVLELRFEPSAQEAHRAAYGAVMLLCHRVTSHWGRRRRQSMQVDVGSHGEGS